MAIELIKNPRIFKSCFRFLSTRLLRNSFSRHSMYVSLPLVLFLHIPLLTMAVIVEKTSNDVLPIMVMSFESSCRVSVLNSIGKIVIAALLVKFLDGDESFIVEPALIFQMFF